MKPVMWSVILLNYANVETCKYFVKKTAEKNNELPFYLQMAQKYIPQCHAQNSDSFHMTAAFTKELIIID